MYAHAQGELTNNLFSLKGRTILVTGAAGHLGTKMAEGIALAGASVLVNSRSPERAKAFVERLVGDGHVAKALPFDVTDVAAVKTAIDSLDSLDGIVNNAYAGAVGTIETSTAVDFEAAYRLNAVGPFNLVKSALHLLRASKHASVVNIASMYGKVSPDPAIYGDSGKNNPPHYGPSKAGMIQLTRYLACHLAKEGIRVNSISPGTFPPPEIKEQNPSFHAELCKKNPMNRIGRADELVGPVIFLLSDASSYVTGADLAVDGGWTAW